MLHPVILLDFGQSRCKPTGRIHWCSMNTWLEKREVGPGYVFPASGDVSYFTGQVLHPNGSSVMNA